MPKRLCETRSGRTFFVLAMNGINLCDAINNESNERESQNYLRMNATYLRNNATIKWSGRRFDGCDKIFIVVFSTVV